MLNQRDIIAKNIKIISEKEVSIINNNNEDYIFSALTVEGGGSFKKGISIGMQDKMIPGLIIYDEENFYGYSEKFGLVLLSTHPEYNELSIPNSTFENKAPRIQPTEKNDNFKNLKETEKDEQKSLNIDLEMKDITKFYIIIPNDYNLAKFTLTFNITYIFDINSIISNLSLVIINESNKSVFINITNNNCFYKNNYDNIIEKNSINKIYNEVINNNYFLVSKDVFIKHS